MEFESSTSERFGGGLAFRLTSTSEFTGGVVLEARLSASHTHDLPEGGHLDFVRQRQFSQHRQGGNELTVVAGLGRLWSWFRASVAHSRPGIVRNCRSYSAFKLRRAAFQAECRAFESRRPLWCIAPHVIA